MKENLEHMFRSRIGVFEQYPPRPLSSCLYSRAGIKSKSFPMVSIVTPSYNQGQYLERTIKSVIQQDYPGRIEYVIQDGISTDNSLEIIQQFSDSSFIWESTEDAGQADALNKGFSKTTGELMAFINSDDIYLQGAFRKVAAIFDQNPDVDVIYSHRLVININDLEIGRWVLPPFNAEVISYLDYIPQETVFWRRSIWEKSGGRIDAHYQYAFDWELILRFLRYGGKIVRIPDYFSAFRFHPDQKTIKDHQLIQQEVAEIRKITGRTLSARNEFFRKAYFLESIFFDLLEWIKSI